MGQSRRQCRHTALHKGRCIERAIRSVQDQTVPCGEIVIVDDGSTDDGGRCHRIEDRRIRLFRQTNQGPSAARNRGSKRLGELIAFLGSMMMEALVFESVLHLRARCPGAGAYATAYEIREPDGRVWTPSFRGMPAAPWEDHPELLSQCAVEQSGGGLRLVITKEVFGKLDVLYHAGVAQDAELWAGSPCGIHRFQLAHQRGVPQGGGESSLGFMLTHVFATDCFERAMQSQQVLCTFLRTSGSSCHQKLVGASRYIVNGQSAFPEAS